MGRRKKGMDSQNKQELPREVGDLLYKFQNVFKEPEGLPPRNRGEHNIHIKNGCELVVVRPYRYAHSQKNEMEQMVRDMQFAGIIQPRTSPYSSPVILVKKRWQLKVLCRLSGVKQHHVGRKISNPCHR